MSNPGISAAGTIPSNPSSGLLSGVFKTVRGVAKAGIVGAALVAADQATGSTAENWISAQLQKGGLNGLDQTPYISGLLDATKGLTDSVTNGIKGVLPDQYDQYAGYGTAGLAALTGVAGWGLSNLFNGNHKNTAYKQAQDIADNSVSRIKSLSRGGWFRGSKATEQTYYSGIQQDLNSIKGKAGTVLNGVTDSLDSYKKQSQIGDINSALAKLREKGVISGNYRFEESDFDRKGLEGSIIDLLNPKDQKILGEWTSDDFNDEITAISQRKAVSAKKSGWGMTVVKFGAMVGAGLVADEVLLGGWGREKIMDGLSGIFNAESWNPFDLAVQAGQGIDPGIMKMGAGMLMLAGSGTLAAKVASEHGGMMGITTFLAAGSAIGLLGMNSDSNVNWSNESQSYLTAGRGGYADVAKKYFSDWSLRMGG